MTVLNFYLITQWDSYEQDITNGYLWERITNHNIKELNIGDIIFHNNGP